VSVALLVGSERLRYPWLLRLLALVLAVPLSLQLLPPAWSVGSLISSEFRVQSIALGISWLLLAGFWFWGRLPASLTGGLSAILCLAAILLPAWQVFIVKPAVDAVYGRVPPIGWGFFLCMTGLLLTAVGSLILAIRAERPPASTWAGD
jgi:hypothetical protein